MTDTWSLLFGDWEAALAALLAATLFGWLAKTLLYRQLRALAARTETRADELLLEATRSYWLPAAFLIGVLSGNRLAPLAADAQLVIERAGVTALLLVLTLATSRFVGRWFAGADRAASAAGALGAKPSLVAKAARVAVLLAGVLLVLDNAGLQISTLLTVAGVGSLAVGLALQPTLSNFFAGLHLSVSKPIRVGDFIELEDGTQGEVVDISWRATTIRQLANNLVVVPNSRLAEMRISNYTLPQPSQAVLVGVGVSYRSDLRQVERVTLDVARQLLREVPEGDPEFDPAIRFHTFGDSSIDFNVVLRARSVTDRFALVHEFHVRLKERYDAEGIEIPFPQRVVHRPEERDGASDESEGTSDQLREERAP
jgi:small-conductance mechanosensitive channel